MRKTYLKFALPIVILVTVLAVMAGCSTTTTAPGTTATVTTTAPGTTATATTTITTSSTTTTTPSAPKDKIVVGMSRPLSGWNAVIGDSAFRPVYETWVARTNADGGVYVAEYGKKLPIEMLIYDDKSDVGTMTRLTEKLILEDEVDYLWPASGTAFLFAQAPIANKYEYVLITAEGGATSLMDMLPSLPWIFVSLSFSNWNEVPVLADILSEKGCESAYIMYISDLHGIEYNGQAGIEFGRVGIDILGTKAVPPDIQDLSPIIKEAMDSGADAFLALAYPDQVIPATFTSMELGYNPKFFLGGPGVNFGFYHTTFGAAAEGVSGWTTFARKSSPALNELADILYTGKPEETNDWWGHPLYWAALDMWKAGIEKAGTLDQKALRDILATEHFDTVLGDTWFTIFGEGGGGLLAKETHPGEVGQWINGVFEVIGPTDKATADFLYPKPPWPTP